MHMQTIVRLSLCLLLIVLCGCAGIQRGGAPKQSFDANADLKALADKYQEASKIEDFYKNETESKRDEIVAGRLVLMNIRYIQFIRELTRERQLLDSATDILLLSLNLAGASTGSTEAKTVLHAVAAGLGGAKVSIDKNYYYEKTVPALVAAMNAERARVMARIKAGLTKPLSEYKFVDAIVDLHSYYEAGTFLGAINAIQVDAGEKKVLAEKEIALLKELTPDDVASKRALTAAVGTVNDAKKAQAITLLRTLGNVVPDDEPVVGVKARLQTLVRSAKSPAEIADLTEKFRTAGLL